MRRKLLPLLAAVLAGCTGHRVYDTAQFRERPVRYDRIALHENGLTTEQIAAISATPPPAAFPVDVCVLVVRGGYVDARLESMFLHALVGELQASGRIDRVTPIPSFLVPERISFNALQEIGVRSLSEYVLVLHLDASEFYRRTSIVSGRYEVGSSVSFLLVDSGTAALLTADRLDSTEAYRENPLRPGGQQEAQAAVFAAQAKRLGAKLDALLRGE